jgi:hypothetical protein
MLRRLFYLRDQAKRLPGFRLPGLRDAPWNVETHPPPGGQENHNGHHRTQPLQSGEAKEAQEKETIR